MHPAIHGILKKTRNSVFNCCFPQHCHPVCVLGPNVKQDMLHGGPNKICEEDQIVIWFIIYGVVDTVLCQFTDNVTPPFSLKKMGKTKTGKLYNKPLCIVSLFNLKLLSTW